MTSSSRTDWNALKLMSDDDIDYSDIPALDARFFEHATVRIPAAQAQKLVPLDDDVLNWFRSKGPEYQSLINSVLRNYMSHE